MFTFAYGVTSAMLGKVFVKSAGTVEVNSSMRVIAIASALLAFCGCVPEQNQSGGKSGGSSNNTSEQIDASEGLAEGVPADAKLTKVVLQLNWYPEAEHGGFYAAQVQGIYRKYGLDVEVRAGGKSLLVPQELVLNRIQFGVANADDVLIARNQDVPMVALMAPIQDGPRCLLTRKDSGIDTFEKLQNVKLQIDSSRPYVPFLKSKNLLHPSVEVVPYQGSVSLLVAEKNVACQGYNFSEPFMARKQGVEVNELMLSDVGYNPYASLLVTTDSYYQSHRDICEKMRQASIEGWQAYLDSPEAANEVILKNNKQGMEKDALDYGVEALRKLCLPEGTPKVTGQMSEERWLELATTLGELKLIDTSKQSASDAAAKAYIKF